MGEHSTLFIYKHIGANAISEHSSPTRSLSERLKAHNGSGRLLTVLSVFFTLHSSLFVSRVAAQDEPEYRMEIGGGIGLVAYEGDLNGSLFKNIQPRATLTAKYKMNPRMAWSAAIGLGQLKGSSDNVDTWYPVLNENPVTFKTTLTDLGLRYEYNFFAFGTGQEYHGARPFTPFIAIGFGLAWASSKVKGYPAAETLTLPDNTLKQPRDGSVMALQWPVGFGVKYKVKPRLNLTAEWIMHFTGSDRIDGLSDPYGIVSSGLFKNTDSYSTLHLSLTYDIWAKCKTCHSDRDL